MSDRNRNTAPLGWVNVRVEDTGDGLVINPDDARKWRLRADQAYEGRFLPDGTYRIAIPQPLPSQPAERDDRRAEVEPLLRTRFKLSFNKAGNCTVFRKDQAEELDGQWVWLIDASDGSNCPLYSQATIDALTADRDRLKEERDALIALVFRAQFIVPDAQEAWHRAARQALKGEHA